MGQGGLAAAPVVLSTMNACRSRLLLARKFRFHLLRTDYGKGRRGRGIGTVQGLAR